MYVCKEMVIISPPPNLKKAIIKPHIKRPNLDTEEMKNYRPVSNLHFVSKILKKLVVTKMEEHMSNYNLYDPLQSAYRSKHSTETAVLKIQNDIIGNHPATELYSRHH